MTSFSCRTGCQQFSWNRWYTLWPYLQWTQKPGGEGSTLNFSYPPSMLLFLFQFMHSVERDEVLLAVGGGNWVENPNVEKGLLSFAPKVACSHIQSRFVFPVGRSQLEHLIMKCHGQKPHMLPEAGCQQQQPTFQLLQSTLTLYIQSDSMLCCLNFQNHCMTHVHFFIPYTIMLTRAVCMCAYHVSSICHFQKKSEEELLTF